MKVLLIDIDSTMPNLALMKISAWHKKQGDKVYLNQSCDPDKVYISCVFSQNKAQALGIAQMFNCPVELGGYGINDTKLPDEIEHIMPDYDLYGIDYSMGFTSRGCIRNCPWCIVPKVEGKIRVHASITEFMDPHHQKVILLDNNLLAAPNWKKTLRYIVVHRLEVNFNQGLDIRLIDDEKAAWLSKCKAKTWTFQTDMLHFAFDDINYEKAVRKGVETLASHGIGPYKQTFYFLCGFNSTFEEDMYRFTVLRELGVHPYCMVYNGYPYRRDNPLLRLFERWVNRHLYKVCDFKTYNRIPNKLLETITE